MDQDTVPRQEFELTVRALVLRIQMLAEVVAVTTATLANRVVNQAEFDQMLVKSRRSGTSAKLKQALSDLQRFEAIRNVLRDFEGPPQ